MVRLVEDDQIIEVILKNQKENLTVRRLMDLLGLQSTAAVHQRLKGLEKKGLIKRTRKTIIEVVKQ